MTNTAARQALMAALGEVLLQWARLEATANESGRPAGANGTEFRSLRKQRNQILHEIAGIAMLDAEPSIICRRGMRRSPDGAERRFTLSQLQALASAMESCRIRIARAI